MEVVYNGIPFEDAVKDEDDHIWSEVCESCVIKFGISNDLLVAHTLGLCCIDGCANESDYYIDFPDSAVCEI